MPRVATSADAGAGAGARAPAGTGVRSTVARPAPPPPSQTQPSDGTAGGAPPQGRVQQDPRFRDLPREAQREVEGAPDPFEALGKIAVDPELARAARREGRKGSAQPPGSGGGEEGAGGGGGGGGGGPQTGEGGYHAPTDVEGGIAGLDMLVKENIEARLKGEGGMTSEQLNLMKSKLRSSIDSETARRRQSLFSTLVARGVMRGGAAGEQFKDLELGALKAYSTGMTDILIRKAEMDHADKLAAVDSAMQWVNNTRQYMLGKEQNAIAREQIKATLEAASMQASASRYAADQSLKGARASAGATRWAAQAQMQASSYVNPTTGSNVGYNGGTQTMSLPQAEAYHAATGSWPGT